MRRTAVKMTKTMMKNDDDDDDADADNDDDDDIKDWQNPDHRRSRVA